MVFIEEGIQGIGWVISITTATLLIVPSMKHINIKINFDIIKALFISIATAIVLFLLIITYVYINNNSNNSYNAMYKEARLSAISWKYKSDLLEVELLRTKSELEDARKQEVSRHSGIPLKSIPPFRR
jgi:hypothetical protein